MSKTKRHYLTKDNHLGIQLHSVEYSADWMAGDERAVVTFGLFSDGHKEYSEGHPDPHLVRRSIARIAYEVGPPRPDVEIAVETAAARLAADLQSMVNHLESGEDL